MQFPARACYTRSAQNHYNIHELTSESVNHGCDRPKAKAALEYVMGTSKAVHNITVSMTTRLGNALKFDSRNEQHDLKDLSVVEMLDYVTKDKELWNEIRFVIADKNVVTSLGVREVVNMYVYERRMEIKRRSVAAAENEEKSSKKEEKKSPSGMTFGWRRRSTGSIFNTSGTGEGSNNLTSRFSVLRRRPNEICNESNRNSKSEPHRLSRLLRRGFRNSNTSRESCYEGGIDQRNSEWEEGSILNAHKSTNSYYKGEMNILKNMTLSNC
mmetsp:Transcript_49965/g.60358  ORF Transcript_49965/g.60358 Transcript_49965/m.60358 type:complete len:270 (+) Transcript_49965:165-974(+)